MRKLLVAGICVVLLSAIAVGAGLGVGTTTADAKGPTPPIICINPHTGQGIPAFSFPQISALQQRGWTCTTP